MGLYRLRFSPRFSLSASRLNQGSSGATSAAKVGELVIVVTNNQCNKQDQELPPFGLARLITLTFGFGKGSKPKPRIILYEKDGHDNRD
jgi:hypothetical protein